MGLLGNLHPKVPKRRGIDVGDLTEFIPAGDQSITWKECWAASYGVPIVAEKFKPMCGTQRGNPLAAMSPRKPSGDSGFVFSRPTTGVAGLQTVTSGLRRVIWRHVPTIGFRGTSREDADVAGATRRAVAAHCPTEADVRFAPQATQLMRNTT
jgi:hypothetical protein